MKPWLLGWERRRIITPCIDRALERDPERIEHGHPDADSMPPLVLFPLTADILIDPAGPEGLGKRQRYLRVIAIEVVGAPTANPVNPVAGTPSASVQGINGSRGERRFHSNRPNTPADGNLENTVK